MADDSHAGMRSQAESNNDLLILLLDAHLMQQPASPGTGGSSLLEQVLYFVAAFLMTSDSNHLAVFALMPKSCELLHLSLGKDTPSTPEFANPGRCIHSRLLAAVQQQQQQEGNGESGPGPPQVALSAGLSRALCLVHRLRAGGAARATLPGTHAPERCKPRILCVVGQPDARQQYVAVMNTIFSAQRAEVVIDALVAGPTPSSYLQQAAHLTGGVYLQTDAQQLPKSNPSDGQGGEGGQRQGQGLRAAQGGGQGGGQGAGRGGGQGLGSVLQHLLTCFATDTRTRAMLKMNQPLGVDFRASCFCHKKLVDVGHVCSVCLSIFCHPIPQCLTCGTTFEEAEKAGGGQPS